MLSAHQEIAANYLITILVIDNGAITLLNDVGPRNITVRCQVFNLSLSAQLFEHEDPWNESYTLRNVVMAVHLHVWLQSQSIKPFHFIPFPTTRQAVYVARRCNNDSLHLLKQMCLICLLILIKHLYNVTSLISHMWKPKCTILRRYVVLTWMHDKRELVACDIME